MAVRKWNEVEEEKAEFKYSTSEGKELRSQMTAEKTIHFFGKMKLLETKWQVLKDFWKD